MKKIISLWTVILLIVSMALVSHAKMEKIAISGGNLAELKGEWIGSRTIGPGTVKNTDLEILNDTLPLQVKLTFYDVKKPGKAFTTEIRDFKGKINDQGNLFFKGPNNEVELSLYKDDGKMKLEGTYYWFGSKGTMSFKKK
jgi:hypothetical protein